MIATCKIREQTQPYSYPVGLPGVPASFLISEFCTAATGTEDAMPGNPVGYKGTEEQRFWAKVSILENGCWQWTASLSPWGYGEFALQGSKTKVAAHRWSYERYIGPIPEELEPDHLCRNRGCVYPTHLEPVTHRTNLLRGQGVSAKNAVKTVCPEGHPLSKNNLVVSKEGWRRCRTCYLKKQKQQYQKRKAKKG